MRFEDAVDQIDAARVCRTRAGNDLPQNDFGLGDRRALGRVERGRGNSKAVMFDCR